MEPVRVTKEDRRTSPYLGLWFIVLVPIMIPLNVLAWRIALGLAIQ